MEEVRRGEGADGEGDEVDNWANLVLERVCGPGGDMEVSLIKDEEAVGRLKIA